MKIIRAYLTTILDMFSDFTNWLKNSLKGIANLMYFVMPYFMYISGNNFHIKWSWMLVVPIITIIVVSMFNRTVDKLGRGRIIPIPEKRFTEVDKDGEVSVETNRLQEMLLYLADVEDYIERMHYNK